MDNAVKWATEKPAEMGGFFGFGVFFGFGGFCFGHNT